RCLRTRNGREMNSSRRSSPTLKPFMRLSWRGRPMEYVHEKREPREQVINREAMPKRSLDLHREMKTYLQDRYLDFDLAVYNHWYLSHSAGDDHTRIVIPATSMIEDHIYWQARAIYPHVKHKYQSPTASRLDALVVVYPPEHEDSGMIVVVEGPMDALAAADVGYTGIALMGNEHS